jgi:DNA-binding CsgD family transcriptional regulator
VHTDLALAPGLALDLIGQAATAVLDQWRLGVVLLDRKGRVLFMNRAAEVQVDEGDGLSVDSEGRLVAALASDTARLLGAVRAAADERAGGGASGVIALPRRVPARPHHLLVAPLPALGSREASAIGPACVVLLSNPRAGAQLDEDLLQRLYGLTPAESRVVTLMIQGHDVKSVSRLLNVSVSTTRTHVKRVLAKTSTRRQAELAVLVLSGPASFGALR